MKKLRRVLGSAHLRLLFGITGMATLLTQPVAIADFPQWWLDRNVVNTNATANQDFAALNQGQLKNVALAAYNELNSSFPDSDTSVISNLVSGFSTSNNYAAVNLGQLKFVATPFYDFISDNNLTNMWPEGMSSGAYPWSGEANDHAVANIGQLKFLFSFDMAAQDDLHPLQDADGDGLPTAEDPDDYNPDFDNDGIGDGYEVLVLGTDPADGADVSQAQIDAYLLVSRDPDGDARPDWLESLSGTNPHDSFD